MAGCQCKAQRVGPVVWGAGVSWSGREVALHARGSRINARILPAAVLPFLLLSPLFSLPLQPRQLPATCTVYVCAERSVCVLCKGFCPEGAKGAASLPGECASELSSFASLFVSAFLRLAWQAESGNVSIIEKGEGKRTEQMLRLKRPLSGGAGLLVSRVGRVMRCTASPILRGNQGSGPSGVVRVLGAITLVGEQEDAAYRPAGRASVAPQGVAFFPWSVVFLPCLAGEPLRGPCMRACRWVN